MSKSDWFLIFIFSFLFGIFVGDLFISGEFFKVSVLFVVYLFFAVCMGYRMNYNLLLVLIFSLVAIFCGILRLFISLNVGENDVSNYRGVYQVYGCINGEVEADDIKLKYVIDVEKILVDNKWAEASGKILVSNKRYPEQKYGDCIVLVGELEAPGNFGNFAYDEYLAKDSIYSVVNNVQKVEVVGNERNRFFDYIYKIKKYFEAKIFGFYPEPDGSFVSGLMLGSRKGIPAYLMRNFNATGLSHIIAISGYNISLVVVFAGFIFGFLRKRFRIFFTILFVVLFVILVGMGASVVRAAIMGVISLSALWFYREYFVFVSLFAAAFFMNLLNPKILIYDISFQLSFLATLGIVVFSSWIERYLKIFPKFFGVRENLKMTFSAQIFVLPIILLNFERLSLISPIANVLVLPFIPLVMILGFVSILLGFFSDFLGRLIALFPYLILEFVIFIVNFFASLNFSSVEVGYVSWWILFFYYFLVGGFILFRRPKFG